MREANTGRARRGTLVIRAVSWGATQLERFPMREPNGFLSVYGK